MKFGLSGFLKKPATVAEEHEIGADMAPSSTTLAERAGQSGVASETPRPASSTKRSPFLTNVAAPIRDADA